LHAKWIEMRSATRSAVLTGSINATTKALCSTHNIEVGVLRVSLEGKPWTKWVASEFPTRFEPSRYEFGSVAELLIHAYLAGDGDLSGTILGVQSPPAIWRATLIKPSGESKCFDVTVNLDGKFRAVLPEAASGSTGSSPRSPAPAPPSPWATVSRRWRPPSTVPP